MIHHLLKDEIKKYYKYVKYSSEAELKVVRENVRKKTSAVLLFMEAIAKDMAKQKIFFNRTRLSVQTTTQGQLTAQSKKASEATL